MMLIAMSENLLEMPANFETAFGTSKERASTISCQITKQSITLQYNLHDTVELKKDML